MQADQVRIRELAAWGMDENKYRPETDEVLEDIERSRDALYKRAYVEFESPIVNAVPSAVTEALNRQLDRSDLHAEMKGLEWKIGVVDLRQLIAFQRRLIFDDRVFQIGVPSPDDWPALIHLSFGPPISIDYHQIALDGSRLLLQSANPNFQLRTSAEWSSFPVQFCGGSPFLEVAEFNGRWFLRDGYHRAYRLLCGGISHMPAVIVWARDLSELGPVHPWFFGEETLFALRPPRVTDFLDECLTIEYHRPRLFKTLRVRIEESVEPALFTSNLGEQQ